jgi:quinol monooxygenase YgiN
LSEDIIEEVSDYYRIIYVVGSKKKGNISFAVNIPMDIVKEMGLLERYKNGEKIFAHIKYKGNRVMEVKIL